MPVQPQIHNIGVYIISGNGDLTSCGQNEYSSVSIHF